MTRQYDPIRDETVVLTEDNVKKNRFVSNDGKQSAVPLNKVAGVAQYGGKNGEAISVVVLGTAVVETSAAVSAGDECGVVAGDGRLGGKAAAGQGVARAMENATSAGQFIEIELLPFHGVGS
jgi:Uncharacterized conserved protein (DUF2190)